MTEYTVVAPDVFYLPEQPSARSPQEVECPLTGSAPFGMPLRIGVGRHGNGRPYFVAYAMANLDGDERWDCWSIASFERVAGNDSIIPYNQPYHEQSDYDEKRLRALLRKLFPGEEHGPVLLSRVAQAYAKEQEEIEVAAPAPKQRPEQQAFDVR
jgi:hypothetical protein